MKKTLITLATVAVLGLIVWLSLRESKPRGEGVEVQSATLRTIFSRVKATGEITPEKKVEISAKVVGEIISLPVTEGQPVTAGQLLVEIERDLYEAARDQARAALRQTEVSVRRRLVQLVDAERDLKRIRQLHAEGLVSQDALDTAELAVETSRVEVEASRHTVEQYRSALERAQDDLARTTIRCPMDGTVIQLDAEKGETVVPGSTNLPGSVIMTIGDMSRLLAEVEVSEVDVTDVKLGQPAEVWVDALGSEPQPGRVVEIATSGRRDPAQGTIRFAVKVVLDDPDSALRPAMTAKVDILTATSQDAVTVPIQAVVTRTLNDDGVEVRGSAARGLEETDVVFLIEDNRAVARRIQTGISDQLFVAILAGLDDGDQVIIGPYRTLKDLHENDPVHVVQTSDDEKDGDETGVEIQLG